MIASAPPRPRDILLEFLAVVDRARAAVPWFLVAASVLFAALMLYVLFAGFLPAKHRARHLEAELKALYAQEARLHEKLAQIEQYQAERQQHVESLRAERDELARRVEQLERRLGGERPPTASDRSR
jgi:type II secretory pathway component PulM